VNRCQCLDAEVTEELHKIGKASVGGRGIPDRFGGREAAQKAVLSLAEQSLISVADQSNGEPVA